MGASIKMSKVIKKPLKFKTLYSRFLRDDELLISDEITLKEYHDRGEFEPTITTYTDEGDKISVVCRDMDGSLEDKQDFYYSSYRDSKKHTLIDALYAYSGIIIK